jgi:hypothetical protein
MNQALRQELLALAEQEQSFLGSTRHDQNSDEVQRQLALMGRLSRRLVEILDTHGWPGKTLVGEAEPSQVAFLVDRVSLVERNVQVYGTTICRQADGSFVRPCWRIPTGWMRAAGRSGFLRWKKTSAGSNSSTAAGRTARRKQARSGPLAQLAAATVVFWRVRRSASRLSVQAVGGRAQAFGLLTGGVVGGSTRLNLLWNPCGYPVPMAGCHPCLPGGASRVPARPGPCVG